MPPLSFFDLWKSQARTFSDHWIIYGGFVALLKSPHLYIALLLTCISTWFWATNDRHEYLTKASDLAISTVPNLLGFTVGALAIVLAFSSANIFNFLAEHGEPKSYFMKLTSALVHFISIQVLALIIGIIAKVTDSRTLDVVSLFFLYYAVLVTFAAAMQLFLTAQIYNAHASLKNEEREE